MTNKTFIQAGEVYRNATRPAILASIREVLSFYGVTQKFDQVYFNGEAEVSASVLSDKDSKLRDNRATDTINRRKLFIRAEINRSEFNSGYGNSGTSPKSGPVWMNEGVKTYLFPGYEGREISIEASCYFRTRNEAVGFVNLLERTRSRQLSDFTFSAKIHYPINASIIGFLIKAHQLAVNAKITTDDFAKWFFDNKVAPIGMIQNEANNNATVVVNRRIDDTNIIFEESAIALSQRGDYVGQHLVTFRYKFYWQDMVEWQLHYPMMVYQQPIESEYLPEMHFQYRNGFIHNAFLEYQEGNLVFKNRQLSSPFYYRYPENDTWDFQDEAWLDRQACLLLTLEDVAGQTLLNLKDIPNWKWKDAVLNHMQKYKQYLFTRHEDIIHIKVYSDDLQVRYDQLSIDADGNIILNRKPTMGNCYRVCIYVDLDLKGLSDEAIDRILDDDEYQQQFLPSVFPWHCWKCTPNDGKILLDRADGRYPSTVQICDWIKTKDDWYSHADAGDMGDGTVRFSPVFYQMDADLIAKIK